MRTPRIIFAALAAALALQAQAQVRQPAPAIDPPAAAVIRAPGAQVVGAEVRELSLADATALLKSTAGPAWRVLQVQTPACVKPVKRKNKKACQRIRKSGQVAKKFAQKNSSQIAYSTLYQQTTVLLTTAPKPPR